MSHGYNREYAMREFEEHGETWIQSRLAGKFDVIFDVGSNIGEWSRMARSNHPKAKIHTFEIVPDTYRKMLNNITIDENMIPNSFGLLDKSGPVQLKHNIEFDAMSTTVMDLRLDQSVSMTGLAFTGDEYVESRGIEKIDYLKIDTEGAEGNVLRGFENTLKQGKVKMIQYEYGLVCILTKWMLIDSYRLLEPLGYKIGQLKRDHIEFRDYALIYENFNGPDYVAVHENYWNELFVQ